VLRGVAASIGYPLVMKWAQIGIRVASLQSVLLVRSLFHQRETGT
jgi:hypothetical protein